MADEPETIGVPEEFEATPDKVQERQEALETGQAAMEALKAQGRRPERVMPEGIKTFINPTEPNCRYLVKVGKLIQFRDPNSPSGFKDVSRQGDIWAEFRSGVCASDEPEVIAWCEAHGPSEIKHTAYHKERGSNPNTCMVKTGRCRNINDPMCAAWAEFKSQQIPRANSDATISPSLDIDALFERGLQAAAAAAHVGSQMVETAKATERSIKRRRGEE